MGWGTSEKDLVRLGGLAAVHQVEHLLVPLGALMRERGHRRVDAVHHVVHLSVARRWPPLRPGHPGRPACALSAPAATWAVFLFRDGAVRMVTVPQPWKWNTLAVMPPALESLHPPFRKLSHNASSTTMLHC